MSTSAEWNVYEKVNDGIDALDINYGKYKGTYPFFLVKRVVGVILVTKTSQGFTKLRTPLKLQCTYLMARTRLLLSLLQLCFRLYLNDLPNVNR